MHTIKSIPLQTASFVVQYSYYKTPIFLDECSKGAKYSSPTRSWRGAKSDCISAAAADWSRHRGKLKTVKSSWQIAFDTSKDFKHGPFVFFFIYYLLLRNT